jgi:hypothetical protein
MSKKTVAELFAEKVAANEASLGKELGAVEWDNQKNRHFQRFERGIVLGCHNAPANIADLICTHGRLFAAWWNQPGAVWLGEPLEDLYETTNYDGFTIMVQRFEKGVIWCRSDGSEDVNWLSWRDWHAISKPGDKKSDHP